MRTERVPCCVTMAAALWNRTCLGAVALAIGLAQVPAVAGELIATIPTGSRPTVVAVNPVTGKVYVTNSGSGTVTEIDGATHRTRTVAVGTSAGTIAVNPATNRIYVAPSGTGTIAVIDGATLASTTVAVGANPGAVAVNPVTDKIYVANRDSANVAVIDGATNTVAFVGVGQQPAAIAVNAVTNKIYVADGGSKSVTVIDGATNATTSIGLEFSPGSMAVNPVTNRIYVTHFDAGRVTVIDGATSATTSVITGVRPVAVAVNPATNRIYVANYGFEPGATVLWWLVGSVAVIDGADNSTTQITSIPNSSSIEIDVVANRIYVKPGPRWYNISAIDGASNTVSGGAYAQWRGGGGFAVNPVTHRVYAANFMDDNVYVTEVTTNSSTTVVEGVAPVSVAANPVTGRAYVANSGSGNVTVIDAAGGATTVTAGTQPAAVAANLVTNKVYVANRASNGVTVIDGATGATTTVAAGGDPRALAVNEISNRIYVANSGSNNVTVIEGAGNTTTTVTAGLAPRDVAVNLVHNRVFVANSGSNNVTVIDGANHSTTTIAAGTTPVAIAANPANGKVYVANQASNNVTVIDAASGATGTIAVGTAPRAIATNPSTNKIYVANYGSLNVTVIDGATMATTTVPLTSAPVGISVNPVGNRIYVGHEAGGKVTVIDGIGHATYTLDVGAGPSAIAVDPVTDRIYVANQGGNSVTVVRATTPTLTAHGIDVSMAGGTVSSTDSPTLTLSVCCAYAPSDPAVRAIYVRAGGADGAFTAASGSGPFTATLAGLRPGLNFVTLFAADALEGAEWSPLIGAPRVFALTVAAPSFTTPPPLPAGILGGSYSQQIAALSGTTPNFSVTSGALPAGLALLPSGLLAGTPSEGGFFTFTVTVTDATGGSASRLFALTILATNAPRLVNISTRGQVQRGDNVMIGGFVISGSTPKTVLILARGPSLADFGVPETLPDPRVTLVNMITGQIVTFNDDWGSASNAAVIAATGKAPSRPEESAILITLDPGLYTAVVDGGETLGTGNGIVEVFEMDRPEVPLVNISTRGRVLTGDSVMIGGIAISGDGPQQVLILARGPSLADFGVPGTLPNPRVTLVNQITGHIVTFNDDWGDASNAAAIAATGRAPSRAVESAILIWLDPGLYTAVVDGGPSLGTGVGIVEVFSISP